MTPEQLAEIRARAEAATPGPWMQGFPHRGQVAFGPGPNSMYAWTSERGQLVVGNAKVGADVRFVAHARTDIPALLDYIEELQAEINGAHDVLDTFGAPRQTYELQAHELVTWNLGGRVCRYREAILHAVNGVKEHTNA